MFDMIGREILNVIGRVIIEVIGSDKLFPQIFPLQIAAYFTLPIASNGTNNYPKISSSNLIKNLKVNLFLL
jgi:hypothetical protein